MVRITISSAAALASDAMPSAVRAGRQVNATSTAVPITRGRQPCGAAARRANVREKPSVDCPA